MLLKKKSKIDGDGIFTDRLIGEGEDFYQIPAGRISEVPLRHWARIGDKYICDEHVLNFINHSCEPNTLIDTENMCLIALRDVSPDEEITVDYNKTEINGVKTLCKCGSKLCKGYFLREV